MTNSIKISVKDVFRNISVLNPAKSYISSLGEYTPRINIEIADSLYRDLLLLVPADTLAGKILARPRSQYSDKQLWAISYELMKSEAYIESLTKKLDEIRSDENRKKAKSQAKLEQNKKNSEPIKKMIKDAGFLLKDYYAFCKINYKGEFYSKSFSKYSAEAFLDKNKK